MRVRELWRFPVKSLLGEPLDEATFEGEGIVGDRQFALYDAQTGFGLTARRVPDLLFASAALREDGRVVITLPDGTVAADDDTLSAWLGRDVVLRSADEQVARTYENPDDFEHEATSEWHPFSGATGAFHDVQEARVSLVTTATLGTWDERRFRTNVVLDGDDEDALVGSTVALGEAELDVRMRIPRCVMVTRAQTGGVERDLDVLRTLARERDACLAVGALVTRGGVVRVGDALATA